MPNHKVIIDMTTEEFEEKYISITDEDTGELKTFETYGEELKYVKKYPMNKVWTCVDGEGDKLYLINGFHYVNRLYYVLSVNPWEPGTEIQVEW